VGYEEPEIVEIARFISCPVSQGDNLLSGDFVQAVDSHSLAFENVAEFLVSSQNHFLPDEEEHGLRDGDVHLDRIRIREWTLIAEVRSVAVHTALSVH